MTKKISHDKDSMDINELASLNDDISSDLIDQLQSKLAQDAQNMVDSEINTPVFNVNDDTTLFEEPAAIIEEPKAEPPAETTTVEKKDINIDKNLDDNFIKKYKAKLNKQKESGNKDNESEAETTISSAIFSSTTIDTNIEEVTNGNISERSLTQEQKDYNDSLDFLDGNVKYSKYVIYIDPQNVDFIDSLTVKERKNLINGILRQQDDIAITKKRFKTINTVIKHAVAAILTITVSIPVIYWTINASLEATINNYRRSQTMFQTLYKDNGKITNLKNR
mgnify:CR=1 FL=1